MNMTTLTITTLACAFLGSTAVSVEAGQVASSPAGVSAQAAAQETSSAQGELVDVNATARTLSIKTTTSTMEFRYDDQTKVTGAQKGVAGLATMAGTPVTIQYRKDGSTNHALTIEVRGAPAPRP